MAQALAHHVMIAAHAAELAKQQRHAAVLEERTRLARDIHDTLAQGFTGVIVQLDAAVEALRDEEPEGAAKHIRRARDLARESLGEARRSVRALRPGVLEEASFCEALRNTIEKVTIDTPLRSQFHVEGEPREMTPDVEKNLLRIGQEALTNALKHARASAFQARLCFEAEAVRLELCDNGDGFVVEHANGAGFGLIGMRERAERIWRFTYNNKRTWRRNNDQRSLTLSAADSAMKSRSKEKKATVYAKKGTDSYFDCRRSQRRARRSGLVDQAQVGLGSGW